MKKIKLLLICMLVVTQLKAQKPHVVQNLRITILSTMLAQQGIGEWGFSALVEADSARILFDTGGQNRTVLDNAKVLHIDLSTVPTLVLSHGHTDHTAGWISLRKEMGAVNKSALSVTHVAPGFFDIHVLSNGTEQSMRKDSVSYIQTGGIIIEDKKFTEIYPGVYLTGGNIPRIYPEKNYPKGMKKRDSKGNIVEDVIPEDMSMVILTKNGWVLLSGCGHAGLINTITVIKNNLPPQPLFAAIGGFHLLADSDEQIKWTADELKKASLRYFMGAHCTGIEPVYQIREWAGLKRGECIVGSVGASFDLMNGFTAGQLTH
jgi:7,8-dihydropterin-6-yl-methyl-4-(beta-D-ribofuranosyl)aminobenzene 5'-phosphate synthase